ncbi:MAG: hypothetical protein ACREPV_06455 [Lysobacter sp.]
MMIPAMTACRRHPTPASLLAPLLVALVALAGCGKSAEEAASEAAIRAATGDRAKVERDGDTTTISTEDGSMTMTAGDDLALPDDFPDDIYLPDGYQVRSVMEIDGADVVGIETTGTLASVFDAASATMQRNGWKQVMAMQRDSHRMLGFEKGGRQARMMLVANNDDGGVMLNLQLQSSTQ